MPSSDGAHAGTENRAFRLKSKSLSIILTLVRLLGDRTSPRCRFLTVSFKADPPDAKGQHLYVDAIRLEVRERGLFVTRK